MYRYIQYIGNSDIGWDLETTAQVLTPLSHSQVMTQPRTLVPGGGEVDLRKFWPWHICIKTTLKSLI